MLESPPRLGGTRSHSYWIYVACKRRRRSAYAVPSKAGRKVWAGDLFPLISARHPTSYRLFSAYWVFFLRQGLVVFCLLLASDFIVWDPRCLDGELRI